MIDEKRSKIPQEESYEGAVIITNLLQAYEKLNNPGDRVMLKIQALGGEDTYIEMMRRKGKKVNVLRVEQGYLITMLDKIQGVQQEEFYEGAVIITNLLQAYEKLNNPCDRVMLKIQALGGEDTYIEMMRRKGKKVNVLRVEQGYIITLK